MWYQLIPGIGQVLVGLGSLLISIYLLVTNRSFSKIATHEAMLKSFNEMLRFGLQNPENLQTLGEILYANRVENPNELRQYLTSLTVLNSLEQLLIARRHEGIDEKLADDIADILLHSLMKHPVAVEAVHRGTYCRELVEKADRIIAEYEEKAASQQSSASSEIK